MPVLTYAGENLIAQQQQAGKTLIIDQMILANINGLDSSAVPDRGELMPSMGDIQVNQPITKDGLLNSNTVVYSAVFTSTQGTFDFNWMGLYSSEHDVLVAVAYVPLQNKKATLGADIGNIITKNFAIEFNGAADVTGININAESWQIDYTARFLSMDKLQRNINKNVYGEATFLNDAFKVIESNGKYYLTAGRAILGGHDYELAQNFEIVPGGLPQTVWLSAYQQTTMGGVQNSFDVSFNDGTIIDDYTASGVEYSMVRLGTIPSIGIITDERAVVTDSLSAYNPGNIPHASTAKAGISGLSNSIDSDSENESATPKAVKQVFDYFQDKTPKVSSSLSVLITENLALGQVVKIKGEAFEFLVVPQDTGQTGTGKYFDLENNLQIKRMITGQADTWAELELTEPEFEGQVISLANHTEAEKGGGVFIAKFNSDINPDGGTFAKTPLGHVWARDYSGDVNGQWFGMVGGPDESVKMQAAVNTGKAVYLPGLGDDESYYFYNIIPAFGQILRVYGDGAAKGLTTVRGVEGKLGYIFHATGGYNIEGMTALWGGLDGQYIIGSNIAGGAAGRAHLKDLKLFTCDQGIRFGSEFEHPIGLLYEEVYVQAISTCGINIGGTEGDADSGESAWDFVNVLVPNPTRAPKEYVETVQDNFPSTKEDTVSWAGGDAPEFGYLVLRSADDSTDWHVPPNWISSNYTDTEFVAKKEEGETWFYKAIRMTVGVNLRRGKVVNFGCIQPEYHGIGLRLDDIRSFNVGSLYSEIRQDTEFKGGFCGAYMLKSHGNIQSQWCEKYAYNVFVAGNSKVNLLTLRSSECKYAVIGNTGATDQTVSYGNIIQGTTPKLYHSPNAGAYDYNYDGVNHISDVERMHEVSHSLKAGYRVQHRGVTKGEFYSENEGSVLEVNKIIHRLNSKSQSPISINEVGNTDLVNAQATDIFTVDTIGSNDVASLQLHYLIRVGDGLSVSRQVNSGVINLTTLNVANVTPGAKVVVTGETDFIDQGTLVVTFDARVVDNTVTVSCNADSSIVGAGLKIEITATSQIGGLENVTQL